METLLSPPPAGRSRAVRAARGCAFGLIVGLIVGGTAAANTMQSQRILEVLPILLVACSLAFALAFTLINAFVDEQRAAALSARFDALLRRPSVHFALTRARELGRHQGEAER